VRAHLPPEADAASFLPTLKAGDLYLACACARGDERALQAFDERFLAHLPQLLARTRVEGHTLDELRQILREHLFLGRDGKRGRIADYAGRGPLSSWLRVAAVRTASNLRRKDKGRSSVEEEAGSSPDVVGSVDPELAVIRRRFGEDFNQSLREAFAALEPRERNFLRMHFIDRLGIDKLAPVFQVSRATAARHLAAAREALVERTMANLRARLRMQPEELQSLLGKVRSKLELSLGALLRE
jgi:RNA polymerase sigma-70 factor (ECF subfamily)